MLGSVDPTGQYVAAVDPGTDVIQARVDGVSATATVVVELGVGPDGGRGPGPTPPPPRPTTPGIRWRGELPLNKWMNFYMKVLSRFAHTPGVILRVEFEVPTGDGLTDTKVEETRTALRELGLNETVEQA